VWGDRDRLVFHRGAQRVLSTVPDGCDILAAFEHGPGRSTIKGARMAFAPA
jgi:hypothetical protein